MPPTLAYTEFPAMGPHGGWITVYPRTDHTHTIILLHGRGVMATDFMEQLIAHEVANDGKSLHHKFPSVKWVFPNAPKQLQSSLGCETLQWFDVVDTTKPWEQPEKQWPGLIAGEESLRFIINLEARLLPTMNIVLGGISQGSALALAVFLTSHIELGGFIGLCGWLPLLNCSEDAEPADTDALIDIIPEAIVFRPILLVHSDGDDMVPNENFEYMFKTLENCGMEVHEKVHDHESHWIAEAEAIDDIAHFLITRIGIDFEAEYEEDDDDDEEGEEEEEEEEEEEL